MSRTLAGIAIALVAATALTACVPAVIAVGAGTTAMVATDRRTTGTQVDDEGIELKVAQQANAQYGDRIHINVTSYNGIVLLTGEVPDQGVWASLGNLAWCKTSWSWRRTPTCPRAPTIPTSRRR